MSAALATRHMGKVITAYRTHPFHDSPVSQTTVAAWARCAQPHVSRIENGTAIDSITKLEFWSTLLGIPTQHQWFSGTSDEKLSSPPPTESKPLLIDVAVLPKKSLADEITQRSSKLRQWASWESPAEVAIRLQAVNQAGIHDTTFETMNLAIVDAIARYEAEGPRQLYPQVLTIRKQAQSLLEGWQHPRQRIATYKIAAQASALLGYMAVNVGRFQLAESYSVESASLASAIDDTELLIWIFGTRSFQAYYARDYVKARDFARAGIALSPNSPQAIRLLSNGEARALGMLGEKDQADRSIGKALELAASLNVSSDLTSCISFEPYGYSRIAANAATAYVQVGEVGRVLEYVGNIGEAVEDSDSDWSRSLTKLDVATALLLQANPDLEQSMVLGTEALLASAGRPIESIAQRAEMLVKYSAKWPNHSAVVDYVNAFAAWKET
ncbi:hypothetical protein [Umezawaea sp. Da 62-37]|uniref:hypothetical protein n=1 Tax=Umezawaea sp. Da 62-37 TaxID=3075927 RepID=UPI0028F6E31D|nr:hypothetical protein [Umezawaea sp. Da 62-37]WNV83849.1 hypothetical protein RM788_37595 [Umezawaea sp. Da 62-37]